jgi:phosphogluconate dehydratase
MELSCSAAMYVAMATAVALSHDMFDAALMLGVCDKIVPGLIGLQPLPTVFVPAADATGMGNEKRHRCANKPHRAGGPGLHPG